VTHPSYQLALLLIDYRNQGIHLTQAFLCSAGTRVLARMTVLIMVVISKWQVRVRVLVRAHSISSGYNDRRNCLVARLRRRSESFIEGCMDKVRE
jgi:hypothetical protein